MALDGLLLMFYFQPTYLEVTYYKGCHELFTLCPPPFLSPLLLAKHAVEKLKSNDRFVFNNSPLIFCYDTYISVIEASLSDSHTSRTALRKCVLIECFKIFHEDWMFTCTLHQLRATV